MNRKDFINDCVENCFKDFEASPAKLCTSEPVKLPPNCVLIEINGKKINIIKKDENIQEERFKIFLNFLQEVLSTFKLKFHFQFILNTFDEDKQSDFPLFQFSRECTSENHLVIPDPHLIARYIGMRVNDLQRFEDKIPKIVFRGSDTGIHPDAASNERIYFCNTFKDDDRYDFKISKFLVYTPDLLERHNVDITDIRGHYLSQEEQAGYQYIADIDGHTIAWDRNCWALPLNSLLIKFQRSRDQKYETWYSGYLYDNQIVPVCRKPQDVVDLVGSEEEIIKQQKEFSKLLLSRDVSLEYFRRILSLYNEKYHS